MGNSWTSGSDLLGEWGMQVFNSILGFIEFYPDGVRPELRPRGLDRQGRDRGGWRKLTLSVRYQHFELGHAHTLSLGESQLFYTGQFSLCFLICAPWPTRGQAWASHCCAIYFPVPPWILAPSRCSGVICGWIKMNFRRGALENTPVQLLTVLNHCWLNQIEMNW